MESKTTSGNEQDHDQWQSFDTMDTEPMAFIYHNLHYIISLLRKLNKPPYGNQRVVRLQFLSQDAPAPDQKEHPVNITIDPLAKLKSHRNTAEEAKRELNFNTTILFECSWIRSRISYAFGLCPARLLISTNPNADAEAQTLDSSTKIQIDDSIYPILSANLFDTDHSTWDQPCCQSDPYLDEKMQQEKEQNEPKEQNEQKEQKEQKKVHCAFCNQLYNKIDIDTYQARFRAIRQPLGTYIKQVSPQVYLHKVHPSPDILYQLMLLNKSFRFCHGFDNGSKSQDLLKMVGQDETRVTKTDVLPVLFVLFDRSFCESSKGDPSSDIHAQLLNHAHRMEKEQRQDGIEQTLDKKTTSEPIESTEKKESSSLKTSDPIQFAHLISSSSSSSGGIPSDSKSDWQKYDKILADLHDSLAQDSVLSLGKSMSVVGQAVGLILAQQISSESVLRIWISYVLPSYSKRPGLLNYMREIPETYSLDHSLGSIEVVHGEFPALQRVHDQLYKTEFDYDRSSASDARTTGIAYRRIL